MAGNKYLVNVNGVSTEQTAIQVSSGAASAGAIAALDSTGRWDPSTMPVGVNPEADSILASESIGAGSFVNIYTNGGVVNCRNADASSSGKEAHGFALAAVTSGQSAMVYRVGQANTQLTGMTPGAKQFLSTTGTRTETCPTTSGYLVQILGVAISATTMIFAPKPPIVLA